MIRLNGVILKSIAAAILLGLLFFLSNTRFFLSLQEGALKVSRSLFYTAFNFRQSYSSADSEEDRKTIADQTQLEKLRLENANLRKALRFSEERSLPLRGGRIIHYRLELGREFLFVDQGLRAGIKEGDMAVDSLGFLVGIIKEAYEDVSQIEVISNPGQALEVEIFPSGVRALAKGRGARALELELLPAEVPLRLGDFVQFLGIKGNRFSFPLAEIASYDSQENSSFRKAGAVLLAKPEALRQVFIVEARAIK